MNNQREADEQGRVTSSASFLLTPIRIDGSNQQQCTERNAEFYQIITIFINSDNPEALNFQNVMIERTIFTNENVLKSTRLNATY